MPITSAPAVQALLSQRKQEAKENLVLCKTIKTIYRNKRQLVFDISR